MDQFEGYAASVLDLKETYRDQLEIHLGVELEYYPAYLPELLPILRDHGVEYAILGQHFVGNEIDDHYNGYVTGDKRLLECYVNQVKEAMETGMFTYLAHPDLFHFSGDSKLYQEQMRAICKTANSCDMPLELNLLGLHGHRHYPNPWFWEMAAEENLTPYLRPQECGNREGVRWLELTDENGRGLRVQPLSAPLSISVLPYSAAQLRAFRHPDELPPSCNTFLDIAHKRMGVGGDNTWGAPVHPEYHIPAGEDMAFSFLMEVL